MTTVIIEQENTQMINDLYRLLKKYSGLRNLIRELNVSTWFRYDLMDLKIKHAFYLYQVNAILPKINPRPNITIKIIGSLEFKYVI